MLSRASHFYTKGRRNYYFFSNACWKYLGADHLNIQLLASDPALIPALRGTMPQCKCSAKAILKMGFCSQFLRLFENEDCLSLKFEDEVRTRSPLDL